MAAGWGALAVVGEALFIGAVELRGPAWHRQVYVRGLGYEGPTGCQGDPDSLGG
jgi:hypothetical protein